MPSYAQSHQSNDVLPHMAPAPRQTKLACRGSEGGMHYWLLGSGHRSKLAFILEGSRRGNGGSWL